MGKVDDALAAAAQRHAERKQAAANARAVLNGAGPTLTLPEIKEIVENLVTALELATDQP